MINTTDFLDALRSFEHIAKQKDIPNYFKRQAKIYLLIEIDRIKNQIENVDLDDELEVIEGTNETLKNL